jgi:hypothetical protein
LASLLVAVAFVGCGDDGDGGSEGGGDTGSTEGGDAGDTGGTEGGDTADTGGTEGGDTGGTEGGDTGDTGGTDGGDTEGGDTTDTEGGDTFVPTTDVVLNEIVVATLDGSPDWIELFNRGDESADVSGWVLKDNDDAHGWAIPEGTSVAAGGYLLVYGPGGAGSLVFDFGLGKGGDAVRLYDAGGTLVDTVTYGDGDAPGGRSYGRYPNGTGGFTTLTTPTPGAENEPPGELPTWPNVWVNEVVVQAAELGLDSVELYNPNAEALSLEGWLVTDKPGDDVSDWDLLSGGLSIPANGFLVLTGPDADGLGGDFTFGLGGGDDFAIATPDGQVKDVIAWVQGQVPVGHSFGRYPDGQGTGFTLDTPTPGSANAAPPSAGSPPPALPSLVVTEIHPNPVNVDDAVGEWFELANFGDASVDINGWLLTNAVGDFHVIDTGDALEIEAGERIVLGRSDDTESNGGAPVDYAYGDDLPLGNFADSLQVIAHGALVERVKYDADDLLDPWTVPQGAAMSLDPTWETATTNDTPGHWCPAISTYGTAGELGTPGEPNPACE